MGRFVLSARYEKKVYVTEQYNLIFDETCKVETQFNSSITFFKWISFANLECQGHQQKSCSNNLHLTCSGRFRFNLTMYCLLKGKLPLLKRLSQQCSGHTEWSPYIARISIVLEKATTKMIGSLCNLYFSSVILIIDSNS